MTDASARRSIVHRYAESLTTARLRMHAVVLAAGLWITAVYTLATPGAFDRNGILKGVDFLQFYTAARMVARHAASRLYDWPVFIQELQRLVPGTGDLLFVSVYPPQLALAMAPLGNLSYLVALIVWTVVSAGLYAVCVRAAGGVLPELDRAGLPTALLALAFPPFLQLIMHGQVGALALACLTAAWLALRRGRWWLAGFALGSLCFKPQLLTAAVLAILVTRSARLLAGAAAAAVLQITVAAAALGTSIWWSYLEKVGIMLRLPGAFEPKPWQMHNLKGFWHLLIGENDAAALAWALSAAAAFALVLLASRRTRSADVRMTLVVVGTVLLNPHLYIYDLIVLAVPFAALGRWLLDNATAPRAPTLRVLLHLLWWAPLAGPLAVFTRVQVTPILLAALLWTLGQAVRDADAPAQPIAHPRTV